MIFLSYLQNKYFLAKYLRFYTSTKNFIKIQPKMSKCKLIKKRLFLPIPPLILQCTVCCALSKWMPRTVKLIIDFWSIITWFDFSLTYFHFSFIFISFYFPSFAPKTLFSFQRTSTGTGLGQRRESVECRPCNGETSFFHFWVEKLKIFWTDIFQPFQQISNTNIGIIFDCRPGNGETSYFIFGLKKLNGYFLTLLTNCQR